MFYFWFILVIVCDCCSYEHLEDITIQSNQILCYNCTEIKELITISFNITVISYLGYQCNILAIDDRFLLIGTIEHNPFGELVEPYLTYEIRQGSITGHESIKNVAALPTSYFDDGNQHSLYFHFSSTEQYIKVDDQIRYQSFEYWDHSKWIGQSTSVSAIAGDIDSRCSATIENLCITTTNPTLEPVKLVSTQNITTTSSDGIDWLVFVIGAIGGVTVGCCILSVFVILMIWIRKKEQQGSKLVMISSKSENIDDKSAVVSNDNMELASMKDNRSMSSQDSRSPKSEKEIAKENSNRDKANSIYSDGDELYDDNEEMYGKRNVETQQMSTKTKTTTGDTHGDV